MTRSTKQKTPRIPPPEELDVGFRRGVTEDDVAKSVLAAFMRDQVCKELGLTDDQGRPAVAIEWVSRKEIGGAVGDARGLTPDRIFIAADQSPKETALTVAHELRHLWQYEVNEMSGLKGVDNPDTVRKAEQDACRYEKRAWRTLCRANPDAAWCRKDLPAARRHADTDEARSLIDRMKTMNRALSGHTLGTYGGI